MKIYMAVTKDALSLPLAVADSAAELAELRGVQVETIRSLISRGRTGKIKRPGYIVVEVEEDAPPEKKAGRRKQTGEFDGEIFRERIRLLREKNGMTQKDFAAFTGTGHMPIYEYERKDKMPRVDMLFRIARKTGCSVDWLIGLKEEEGKCRR